ncbi:MAG TPA: NADPH:quinone oxidoreductase family protein, partial [Acidimicrobiia bacterium]|nr:NADPH:quinone oxidoreductase family protein [Acidimicrobiia bacterium]
MRAWQVVRHGEPTDALRLADVDLPEPEPDQIRLRVRAAALALPDVMMCRGAYAYTPALPFTPGQEVVGDVTAVGADVANGVAVGDRVMTITKFDEGHGGFADETLARATNAYRVPDGMSDADGAGFLIAYLTGWLGLVTRGRLERGEWLAVLGAAGGTGSAAVRIGAALGARVIAVVGGDEKARYCRALGVESTVDHHTEDVGMRLRELTAGHGADVIYDPVGGTPALDALGGIANEGRLLAIGFASGETTHPSARDILRRNCSIVGVFTGAYDRAALESVHGHLVELVRRGA